MLPSCPGIDPPEPVTVSKCLSSLNKGITQAEHRNNLRDQEGSPLAEFPKVRDYFISMLSKIRDSLVELDSDMVHQPALQLLDGAAVETAAFMASFNKATTWLVRRDTVPRFYRSQKALVIPAADLGIEELPDSAALRDLIVEDCSVMLDTIRSALTDPGRDSLNMTSLQDAINLLYALKIQNSVFPPSPPLEPSGLIPWSELTVGPVRGSGPYGDVYGGSWRGLPVAIRILPDLAPGGSQALLELSKKLTNLKPNKNVVQVYGAVIEEDYHAVVTEWVDGGTLADLLHQSRCPLGQGMSLKVGKAIAAGLAHLHRSKIVHGNLTPANVLVTRSWDIKLTDVGMADVKAHAVPTSDEEEMRWAWITPEQRSPLGLTTGTDIWSWGMIIYEVLTRKIPYHGLTRAAAREAIFANNLVLPEWPQGMTLCPAETAVVGIVKQCWVRNAVERPKSSDLKSKLPSIDPNPFQILLVSTPMLSFSLWAMTIGVTWGPGTTEDDIAAAQRAAEEQALAEYQTATAEIEANKPAPPPGEPPLPPPLPSDPPPPLPTDIALPTEDGSQQISQASTQPARPVGLASPRRLASDMAAVAAAAAVNAGPPPPVNIREDKDDSGTRQSTQPATQRDSSFPASPLGLRHIHVPPVEEDAEVEAELANLEAQAEYEARTQKEVAMKRLTMLPELPMYVSDEEYSDNEDNDGDGVYMELASPTGGHAVISEAPEEETQFSYAELEPDMRNLVEQIVATGLSISAAGKALARANWSLELGKNILDARRWMLVRKFKSVRTIDPNGLSALHHAAKNSDTILCRALLCLGAIRDLPALHTGLQPLHMAASSGATGVVYLLAESGAPINAGVNGVGPRALHFAAAAGHTDLVAWLVQDGGASPNTQATINDRHGLTPLHLAARGGHRGTVKWLVEDGNVDVDSSDRDGWTALHWAAREDRAEVITYLLTESSGKLLSRAANVDGETPLLIAAQFGHDLSVKRLLSKGAVGVNTPGHEGNRCIHYAALGGHEDLMELLLADASIVVNVKNDRGKTALDLAVYKDERECAKMLKKAGGKRTGSLLKRAFSRGKI